MAKSRYKTILPQVDSVEILKLVYDDGDLLIQGHNRDGQLAVELRFRDVLLTRISYEGVRLRLLSSLGKEQALVLADDQSELISWVSEEGLGTRDMRQAKHFLVLLGQEIVDVVALSAPEISKVES